MADPIKVDIWSDVVCPWCYIGKRKFELGLEAFLASDDLPPVEVEFHSFELSPDMPSEFEGSAVDFLVRHKGVPALQARQMHDHVAAVAAEVGLHYDFDALQPANTYLAHQVLHFARDRGSQVPMKERLMAAHFVEGRHVGDLDELVALAGEVGLDAEEVRKSLEAGEYEPAVEEDKATAARLGIQGVPFFVFEGQFGISGAQAAEVFTEALTRIATGDV